MLRKNTNTIQRNTEALLEANTEVGLEINGERPKYMVMSCHHNG